MDLNVARQLMSSEHPFKWKPHDDVEVIPADVITNLEEQLREKEFDTDLELKDIIIHCSLAYEYYITGEVDKAIIILITGEQKLKSPPKDDTAIIKFYDAMLHVLMAIKTNFLIEKYLFEKAIEAVAEITEISNMTSKNQAALQGIKGIFYSSYGTEGTRCAVRFTDKAMEVDPEESLWYFLKGKYLSRIRRVEKPLNASVSEEIELFEKALQMERNANYMMYTAQTYRETASRLYRRYSLSKADNVLLYGEIEKLNKKSLELYKETLNLKPNCAQIQFRCAKGLIMLPFPYRDEKLAKDLLTKGLKTSPDSSYGNHVMAQYYERIKKCLNSAILHLKICEKKKNFPAIMDLFRIEYRLHNQSDKIIVAFERLYNEHPETTQRSKIISQLTSFYIFKRGDLVKACESVKTALRLNPQSESFLQHRPLCVYTANTINLYDLIIDEIKIALRNETCSSEERNVFNGVLNEIRNADIPVQTKPIYLKAKILKESSFSNRYSHNKKKGPKKYDLYRHPAFQNTSAVTTDDTGNGDVNINELADECKKLVIEEQKKVNLNEKQSDFDKISTTAKGHSNDDEFLNLRLSIKKKVEDTYKKQTGNRSFKQDSCNTSVGPKIFQEFPDKFDARNQNIRGKKNFEYRDGRKFDNPKPESWRHRNNKIKVDEKNAEEFDNKIHGKPKTKYNNNIKKIERKEKCSQTKLVDKSLICVHDDKINPEKQGKHEPNISENYSMRERKLRSELLKKRSYRPKNSESDDSDIDFKSRKSRSEYKKKLPHSNDIEYPDHDKKIVPAKTKFRKYYSNSSSESESESESSSSNSDRYFRNKPRKSKYCSESDEFDSDRGSRKYSSRSDRGNKDSYYEKCSRAERGFRHGDEPSARVKGKNRKLCRYEDSEGDHYKKRRYTIDDRSADKAIHYSKPNRQSGNYDDKLLDSMKSLTIGFKPSRIPF